LLAIVHQIHGLSIQILEGIVMYLSMSSPTPICRGSPYTYGNLTSISAPPLGILTAKVILSNPLKKPCGAILGFDKLLSPRREI